MDPSRLRSAQRVEIAGKQYPNATPTPTTTTLEAPTLELPSALDTAALGDMGSARHLLYIRQTRMSHLLLPFQNLTQDQISTLKVITAKPLPKPRTAPKSSAQQPRAPLTFEHCCEAVWRLVNEEPGGRKNFKKNYGVMFRKCDAVENIIEHGIHRPAVADASFETKFNEAMCFARYWN